MQSDRRATIRERAYQIWLEEGRVDGRHEEHWQRAERELTERENERAVAPAAKPRSRRGSADALVTGETPTAEVRSSRDKSSPVAEPQKAPTRPTRSGVSASRRRQRTTTNSSS